MTIYHYTKGYAVENILKEGFIAREGERGRVLVKPATSFVWFTEKNKYPICALPYIPALPYTNMANHFGIARPSINWKELSEVIGGIFRFEFSKQDSRVEKWSKSSYRAKNCANHTIQMLELSANRAEDYANKFWISHKAMEIKNCKLQMFVDNEWIDLLKFNEEGFVEQLANYTLDDVIAICKQRLCA